ncbi:hypothetical protein HPB50_017983 [Hyalomma asiaticum]|uniref:Uncharacterized protein n=1 Tax=Hyalomma asiaticum TaxID=266040 RepID=A0ACB7TAD6_HYAAI|nr:hypothetical protein HPB50_017983 [Hyalomma asiaticum]
MSHVGTSGTSPTEVDPTLASGQDGLTSASPAREFVEEPHGSGGRSGASNVPLPNGDLRQRTVKCDRDKPRVVGSIEKKRPAESAGPSSSCSGPSPAKDVKLDQGELLEESVLEEHLILYCDPRGSPYEFSDFYEALDTIGLGDDIAGLSPLADGNKWVLQLKTTRALETLAIAGRIKVKGRFCTIDDPGARTVLLTVDYVPFGVPNDHVSKLLEEYGVVETVNTRLRSAGGSLAAGTVRHVRLSLREGLDREYVPHALRYDDNEFLVVVPGRPSLCLRCRGRGHVMYECRAKPCAGCGKLSCRAICSPMLRESRKSQTNDSVTVQKNTAEAVDGPLAPSPSSGRMSRLLSCLGSCLVCDEGTPEKVDSPRETGQLRQHPNNIDVGSEEHRDSTQNPQEQM